MSVPLLSWKKQAMLHCEKCKRIVLHRETRKKNKYICVRGHKRVASTFMPEKDLHPNNDPRQGFRFNNKTSYGIWTM